MLFHPRYNNILQFESFLKFDSLFQFSTAIQGGVSKENYESFNLSMYSGDDIDNVAENRKRLVQILNIDEDDLIIPYQTHEDKILIIDNQFLGKPDLEQAHLLHGIDSLITDVKGICIAVTTADCVPIIIFDTVLKVLAVVHAGWRGTVAKLPEKTIFEMQKRYGSKPENLIAGIGPYISQEHFEVGHEVIELFDSAGFDLKNIKYINNNSGKSHLDLGLANKYSLVEAGIPGENIEISNCCTYKEEDLFFSARRQSIHSGRMLTLGILIE